MSFNPIPRAMSSYDSQKLALKAENISEDANTPVSHHFQKSTISSIPPMIKSKSPKAYPVFFLKMVIPIQHSPTIPQLEESTYLIYERLGAIVAWKMEDSASEDS
jgi:hypothetical protein